LYCNIFDLYLEDNPSITDGCDTLNNHMRNISFTAFIYSAVINNGTDNDSVPVLFTYIGDNNETVYVISEKVSSIFLLNYSIITLYVSVILVIGRVIRGITYG